MGFTPPGAVFERAYRVETFSIKCEHLLSCFFSPFGDWWKFNSVSSFKYCTYSHLKRASVQIKSAVQVCGYGGTGRRNRLRIYWRLSPCRFNSCYPHQKTAVISFLLITAVLHFKYNIIKDIVLYNFDVIFFL